MLKTELSSFIHFNSSASQSKSVVHCIRPAWGPCWKYQNSYLRPYSWDSHSMPLGTLNSFNHSSSPQAEPFTFALQSEKPRLSSVSDSHKLTVFPWLHTWTLKCCSQNTAPDMVLIAAWNSSLWIAWHQTWSFLFIFVFIIPGCDTDMGSKPQASNPFQMQLEWSATSVVVNYP